jgi:leucyl/phenylalanyl-tRNA---protein transferase
MTYRLLDNIDSMPLALLHVASDMVAVGGNLSQPTLLSAYRSGIYPWYHARHKSIRWWSPDPRSLILPGDLRISKRLTKYLRKRPFEVTADTEFEQVIAACSAPRNGVTGTWITKEMLEAYCLLHQAGHAHSVEIWLDKRLVGGLYGVDIGCAFFGESMFSRVPNASKVALIALYQTLMHCNYHFIDCQQETEYLNSMGASNINRGKFQDMLAMAVEVEPRYFPWSIMNYAV